MWLTNATVVDGTDRDPQERQAVQVRDQMIESVGAPVPADAEVIDCDGLTLTPGLIDAHVHLGLSSPIDASLRYELSVAEIAADMFANCATTLDAGFTTVRDTGGIDAGLVRAVGSGRVRGPRIIQCGPVHCQTGGHGYNAAEWEPTSHWDHHAIPGLRAMSLLSDSPDEMRKNVREGFRRGAEFIKLCVTGGVVSAHNKLSDTQLCVEEIAAAVSEAAARGTYVTVHAHNNDGIRNAVEAGARCVEHGSAIDEATARLMADHDVALVPTLAVAHQLFTDPAAAGLPPAMAERVGDTIQGQTDAIHAARAAGVRIGSGSDLIGPDQSHRGVELTLRSRVESPAQALISATATNADILGIGDHVGRILPGLQADIVGFRDDPLVDPERFADPQNVVLVIQGGRVVKDTR